MQKYGLAAMFMAVLLLHGCATPKNDTAMTMAQLRASYEELLSAPEYNEKGDRIISQARKMIGTPYVRGGRNPGGFDCSGLVQWAYKSEGISLPRTAREQSQVGTRITDVEDMRAGDIVAFRHPRRGYHTGIYVGDGKFIHSPHRRDRVKISSLSDPYFRTTFLGARRVSADAGNALDQARSQLGDTSAERLVEYREEQAVRELSKSRKERAARESARSDTKSSKKSSVSSAKRSSKDKSRKVKSKRSSSKKTKVAKTRTQREKVKSAQARRDKTRKTASREKTRKEKTRKTSSREKAQAEKSRKSSTSTQHKS